MFRRVYRSRKRRKNRETDHSNCLRTLLHWQISLYSDGVLCRMFSVHKVDQFLIELYRSPDGPANTVKRGGLHTPRNQRFAINTGTGRYSDSRYSDKCFWKGATNTNSNRNRNRNLNPNPNPNPWHYPFRNVGIAAASRLTQLDAMIGYHNKERPINAATIKSYITRRALSRAHTSAKVQQFTSITLKQRPG